MAGQVARMKHESFQITEDSAPRKKIIRQDRTPVAQKKVFLQVGNYEIEVLNVSSFGLAGLVQEAKVPLLKAMFEQWKEMPGVIRFNNVEAQRLNVKLARIEPHPQSVFNDQIVGFEVFGGTVAVDRLKALELSDEMLRDHTNTFKEMQVIPAAFKLMVFEMKGWLTFLKEKIDTIEKMAPVDNADDNSDFKQTIAESVSEHIGMVIPQKYQDIPKMMADMDDKTVATCTKFIRSQIGPLVYGAPFANRAFYKPRGYAGD